MRIQDRKKYEDEFEYMERAVEIARRRLEKERRQHKEDVMDKFGIAAIIIAAGIFLFLTLAGMAEFGHWLQYGWEVMI